MNRIQRELRKECLKLSYMCQDGNLQSVFSCIDILWVLYSKVMNWSPELAVSEERDFCLVSKGQATLGLLAILKKLGMFHENEVNTIGAFGSRFCIQADITKFDGGFENAAGSLGHGLPMATGIALANKIKRLDSKTYVLVGDGEFMEGTMWESCLFASAKKLENLCIIIDDNASAGTMIDMLDMKAKLESFGFYVLETNGHDKSGLEKTLNEKTSEGCPKAIIAKTIRGYGSRTMMSDDIWFHKAPSKEEYHMLCREVDMF